MSNQSHSPYDSNSYSPSVNVAAYLNLTGVELLQLSNTDFQTRDPQSGSFVSLSLQTLLSQANNNYSISSTMLPSYSHLVSNQC